MTVGALATPVEILQDHGEFARLLDLYRERQPGRVLEIGAGSGGSLYHWLTNAVPGATVVTVDDTHANRDMYDDWADPDVRLIVFLGDSHNDRLAAQIREYAPYDWVFIDADHSLAGVTADWDTYGPMCASGGIVAFHDIVGDRDHNPEIEVRKLWVEIKRQGWPVQEFIAKPDWLGIGVVHV